jgi:hypothetical protein
MSAGTNGARSSDSVGIGEVGNGVESEEWVVLPELEPVCTQCGQPAISENAIVVQLMEGQRDFCGKACAVKWLFKSGW